MTPAIWDEETSLDVEIMGEAFSVSAAGDGWIAFSGPLSEAGIPEALCDPQPTLLGALDAILEAILRMQGAEVSGYQFMRTVENLRRERKLLRERYDFKHFPRGGGRDRHGSKR